MGDFLRDNPEFKKLLKQSVELSKWWPGHSFSYGLFLAEQLAKYGTQLTLILPVVSRWTVYAATLARLLSVYKALEICAVSHYELIWESIDTSKPSKKTLAERVLANCRSREFWQSLAE
jgi:hypothetical protein